MGSMSTVRGELAAVYVVRDRAGRVVVAFWGEDAPDEAARWSSDRRYRVEVVALAR
jgi:hypothetical protein